MVILAFNELKVNNKLETYLEPCQISMDEFIFAGIINGQET